MSPAGGGQAKTGTCMWSTAITWGSSVRTPIISIRERPGAGLRCSPTGRFLNGNLYYGSQGSPLEAFPFSNGQFGWPVAPAPPASRFLNRSVASPPMELGRIVWAAENSATGVCCMLTCNLATELCEYNQAANGRDHRCRQRVHCSDRSERQRAWEPPTEWACSDCWLAQLRASPFPP